MQKRLLVRWANATRSKVEGTSDLAKKAMLEAATKRLQIMESAIKLHRSWIHRSGCQARAWADFESQWQVLTQFASSEPAQPFKCDFLWSLRFQILVPCIFNDLSIVVDRHAKYFGHRARFGARGMLRNKFAQCNYVCV